MTDLRYALRSLLRARWFTAAAILTFAVGIGVNVAVFSIVDRLLFRPLPYRDAGGLVLLRVCGTDGECGGGFPSIIAFEGRQSLKTIDGIAVAAMARGYRLSSADGEAPLRLTGVSANLLGVLGVRPVLGRDFSEEDASQKRRVALIGHEAWQRRFGGTSDIITRSIGAGARAITIVGVLPPGFIPPTWTAVDPAWDGLLLDATGWATIQPTGMIAVPVARLSAGASVAAARTEVDALVSTLATELRGREGVLPTVRVDPIQEALFSRFRSNLWLIVLASFALLLLACANLATLLLARGRSREHAAAVHASLGASPWRLVRAAVFESLAVCLVGSALAIGVMFWTSQALLTIVPPLFSRYAAGIADLRVLLVAMAAALICAIAAGAAPAWRVARVDVLSVLQRSSGSAHRSRLRAGRGLLVVETALGVLLVLSGTLVFRSFVTLSTEDLGFRPEGLYTVSAGSAAAATPPSPSQPASSEAILARYREFVDTLAQVPGVQAAGGADSLVASGEAPMRGLSKDRNLRGGRFQITGGYFETLQTPFIAGRNFTTAELQNRAAAGILSVSAARAYFPNLPPDDIIGRPLVVDGEPARTVVGIVPDLKERYGQPGSPAMFLPAGSEASRYGAAMIRMQAGRTPDLGVLQQRLTERVGPVTVSVAPVSAGLDTGLRDPRFRAVLFAVLAGAALLLAGVGLYAVASFDVAMRRYELGVRMSLGATARDIQRLVIAAACRPVVLGLVLGLAAAYWMEKVLKAFLYGVQPRDPASYLVVIALLLATGALASWLPARRAGRTDPASVLRAQ